jgi:hypothetical protein
VHKQAGLFNITVFKEKDKKEHEFQEKVSLPGPNLGKVPQGRFQRPSRKGKKSCFNEYQGNK